MFLYLTLFPLQQFDETPHNSLLKEMFIQVHCITSLLKYSLLLLDVHSSALSRILIKDDPPPMYFVELVLWDETIRRLVPICTL